MRVHSPARARRIRRRSQPAITIPFPRGRRAVFLATALLAAAACALIGTEERPAAGGVYREAVVGQPLSLNPLLHPNDPITRDVAALAQAGLVRVTESGGIGPDLAEEWSVSDDGRTYTFRLNPRATWHDGRPVTPGDVLATVALLQAPAFAGPSDLAATWRGVRAEAPDSRIVRLHLADPHAPFIEACSVPILPAHVLGSDGSANLVDHPASYVPIGAGPYRVVRVDVDGITLTRHDTHHGPRALLDEVQLRYFPNEAAAGGALAEGTVDGFAGASRAELGEVTTRLEVRDAPIQAFQTVLLMNHANSAAGDPGLRKALALGVDRRGLVDGALHGQAVAAYGPVPAYSGAYAPDLEIGPDRQLAARTLEDAGWRGFPLRARNGQLLRLTLAGSADPRQVALMAGLAAQIEPLGVRIEPQPTQLLDLYRERLLPRQFELALVGVWLNSSIPDPYPLWHSSQRAEGLNFSGYTSGLADQLMFAARVERDPSRRLGALVELQRVWKEDVPGVVLASPLMTYAMSTQVRGVRLGVVPQPAARFQSIAGWHVRTQRVPVGLPG